MALQIQHDRPTEYSTGRSRCPVLGSPVDELSDTVPLPISLIYSPNGLLVVHGKSDYWVVPPATLLQLPPATAYTVRKAEHVSLRVVELPGSFSGRLLPESRLYRLSPLLHELLESLISLPDQRFRPDRNKAA